MPIPDPSLPWLVWWLLPFVLLSGFFLPGYCAFHALPGPLPWVRAFVGSVLLQFFTVLLCNALGIPITFLTLSGGLALWSLGGWLFAGRPQVTLPHWSWPSWSWRDLWWLLPCGAAGASVLARTLIEPLSGWDNIFRWNHLALLIHAQESLNAYPPVSAADFRIYPWCDGIPPALAITNLWIYLGTGSTYGGLIVGRVLVEFALTYGLVWHLAGKLWGATGARFAVATLATSSLFMWSLANSQETGLTGVALLAMAAFALHYQEKRSLGSAVWLMLATSLAALTRDYNLLYLPVAVALLAGTKAPRGHLWPAVLVGVVLVSPWYIRNAWLTGNPLYAESLGGLLRTNPYHDEFMQAVRAYWSLAAQRDSHGYLVEIIAIGSGVLLLLGVGCLVQPDRRLWGLRLLAGTTCVLWLLSISSTAGGWGYSLRVLGPAWPLLAISAGGWALRLRSTHQVLALALLMPVTLDAARRSWILPIDFHEPAWPYTWHNWSVNSAQFKRLYYPEVWAALAVVADGEGIIVDHPMNVVRGGQAGGLMIPLASPEARALINNEGPTDFMKVKTALRTQHIRFVVLSVDTPMNARLLKRWPALAAIRAVKPTIQIGGMLIYDLALFDTAPPRRQLMTDGP